MSDRTPKGTFAQGNKGGPGRPRRAVEADYLAVLSEAVPLDTWREIVSTAVTHAKTGDDKARAFERAQMLRDGGLRDTATVGQLHNADFGRVRDTFEDGTPRGVGERAH